MIVMPEQQWLADTKHSVVTNRSPSFNADFWTVLSVKVGMRMLASPWLERSVRLDLGELE
jgi:hypothetical protein